MNYNRIKNPTTGRFVKVTSTLGKKIIENYIIQLGGAQPINYNVDILTNDEKDTLNSNVNDILNTIIINGSGPGTLPGTYNVVLTNSISVYYPTNNINPSVSRKPKISNFNFKKYLDLKDMGHYYKNISNVDTKYLKKELKKKIIEKTRIYLNNSYNLSLI